MFVFEKEVEYGNVVLEKSFKFSIRIVRLFDHLIKKDRSIESLLKQLLKPGTSVGANISEAQSAYSKKNL